MLLMIFSLLAIFPFYYMVVTAFKTNEEFYENTYAPPARWTGDNFVTIVKDHGFVRSLLNTGNFF